MSFDKELALKLCRLSEKVYSCMTVKIENDGFLLEVEGDTQYLAFPGSLEIHDWWEDIQFVKVERDGMGSIHNGFADGFDLLKHEVYKRIDKSKKLYITGHSYGAGMASLFALSLYQNGYNIDGLYTFGSPRIGNNVWKTNFNNSKIEHYRVKNGNDIVTTMPKLFFYHVGQEIDINKRGWFSWLHNNALDHKIENYIDSLTKEKF